MLSQRPFARELDADEAEVYERENVCYRDAGRALSDIRDSYVKIETVDMLADRYADHLEDGAFASTREQLVDAHRALRLRKTTGRFGRASTGSTGAGTGA